MKMNTLAIANGLSDQDLLARLRVLASTERGACVELVAHLAALDTRPALYAAEGYGSLFSYCTQALRLSEDAACNRIEAARACRRFLVILELLASGDVTLTSVRLLSRHLTAENHQAVLAKASGGSRRQIGRIAQSDRATSRGRSNAQPGGATPANAPSFPLPDAGARSGLSWNSTMFSRMRNRGRRRSRTSLFVVGATTNTKPN